MRSERYRWASPAEWLSEKIQGFEVLDFHRLKELALAMLSDLDSDQLQDLFQDDMEEDGYFQDLDIAANLTREQCVELLEGISIECRDEESVETLREAVQSNIEDETLGYSEVEAVSRG